MTFPFVDLFVALLVAYMIYSVWAATDARYLIGAALLVLLGAAIAEAAGRSTVAATLGEYVFLLLAGGVVLLLIEHARTDRGRPAGPSGGGGTATVPATQAPDER